MNQKHIVSFFDRFSRDRWHKKEIVTIRNSWEKFYTAFILYDMLLFYLKCEKSSIKIILFNYRWFKEKNDRLVFQQISLFSKRSTKFAISE